MSYADFSISVPFNNSGSFKSNPGFASGFLLPMPHEDVLAFI